MILKNKNKFGFTLIELLIFMGLFSILILILTDIFITSLKTKTAAESTASVNQDARFILSKLMNDINNANSINSPALGVTSSSLSIVLYGQPETFQLNSDNLQITNSGGTSLLNSINTKITNLAFTRLGNADGKNTIKINLTVESRAKVNNNAQIINLETAVGLR